MTASLAETIAPPLPRKRWTIDEFDRLVRSDFSAGRGRFALVDGDIIVEGQEGPARKRWTIGEVDRLVDEGILCDGGPEFLWDGEIIEKMPPGKPPHANACDNLTDLLFARLPRDLWTLSPNHPLRLAEGFMPEPDIVVARGPRSNYRKSRAAASDAALVVEVASTSYHDDSGLYLRNYALRGVPLYWIVHIRFRRVEVYSGPIPEEFRFAHRADYAMGESVPLVLTQGDRAFSYESIAVEAILRDSLEED